MRLYYVVLFGIYMQFVVIGRDYKDGLEKRLAVRDQHVAQGDTLKASGNYHIGVALLNDKGEMYSSLMVLDFPSRKELDEWLKTEPYVVNKVWETVEVLPCKLGPSFQNDRVK